MKILNYILLIFFSLSFSFEVLSETRKMEYRCEKAPETGASEFYRIFDIKLNSNGFYGEAKFFSKQRNKDLIQTFTGDTLFSGYFEINSRILSENRKSVTKNKFVRFDKSSQQNVNLIKYLNKGVRGTQGSRFCTLRLLPNSYTSTILMSENFEDKNNLKVADYNENWTIEKLDNGNSVYCNKRKNSWTEFNFGEENWNNYSISYKIKFAKGQAGKLETHIRKKKYTNVEYRSNHRESGVTYLEYVSGPNRKLDRIINGSKALIGDNWLNIKLIASGNNIAYSVNDKIVASTKDDRIKNGAAMIAVSANSKACVDDIIVTKLEENEYHQEANKENKQKEFKAKALAEKKAEEEAKIRALAEKLAKEEIAKQLKQKEEQKKKVEELAKQKALAEKKAEELAKQKALAEKKAEELAKQKALAEKKAKEEARKKALAKKKAEELAKQKALAEKKAKEEAKKKAEELAKQKALAEKKAEEEQLKLKVRNEKIQKLKDEAKYVVATLKEYVKTDANKLDILEVSELLENYNSAMQKGWSDSTLEKYEELYDYVQKDEGFIEFSADKKSKQLAAYNEEIIQLREYLTTSQTKLKAFITNNLGSNNAKNALKLAKETKSLLKDFDVNQAMTLKNDIATWKAMNGVKENKKYKFKLLNKKIVKKKQSAIKKVTQNKLANSTKKKNLKPAPLSVPKGKLEAATFCSGFMTMIAEDNFIKQMPALVKNLKGHSMRHLRAAGILPKRGITGQNMMADGMQVVIDIAGKTIEEADIKRGSPLHSLMMKCSSLDTLKSGIKKSNKTSSVTTISKKKSKPNDKNFKLKQGYFYKKRYADGSCTNRGKEICLSRDQFKNICQKVRGMTVFGRKTAALSASPRAYQLWLESGGYNTDPKTTYSNNVCRVNYYVSGVYKGSNRRDLVSAKAYEFVVDKKGTILIHKMSQY